MKKGIKIILIALLAVIIIVTIVSLLKEVKENMPVKEVETPILKQQTEAVYEENNKQVQLYFCPQQNCSLYLENTINEAEHTIHCALFDLRLENIIEALEEKSNEVEVKVVVDNHNDKGQLNFPFIQFDTSSQLSHNKFCIIDNKKVWTGSFNPTKRGNEKNNNNALLIHSTYLSKNYEAEFQELWNNRFGKGEIVPYPVIYLNNIKIENYFCPEDQCAAHTKQLIKAANKSVHFMTFSFTDQSVADALLFKENNITIQGVFEKLQAASQYSQFERLEDFGLDVKIDHNSANMHHKNFIIDERIVLTGSYNPTGAGNNKNDENILIIHNKAIAERFMQEFTAVYSSPNK